MATAETPRSSPEERDREDNHRVAFSSAARPGDVAEAMVMETFLSGAYPVLRYVELVRATDAPLLPAQSGEVRRIASSQGVTLVVEGDGWIGRFRHDDDFDTFVVLAGVDEATVEVVVKEIQGWKRPPQVEPGRVEMTFCHLVSDGISRHRRKIDAPEWDAIARNYSTAVQAAMNPLVALDPAAVGGRMLLLHGPPGTGKTTLLRTLARAWSSWCDALYVVDPDRLFNEPGYLHSLLLDEDRNEGRWHLVLLEDCDELVRPDAKNASGQALSRLLNLTDGMVGQGLRVLVCLTTNEPLGRLHPAVTRPGRCLAEVEVGRLSRAEAVAWLGRDPGTLGLGASLAELYAIASGTAPLRAVAPQESNGYL
jgi:hypothetical protein